MTGSGALAPDLRAVRLLLDAARTVGPPRGTALELCILTLCLPWEALAIDLELIDWSEAIVPVPARGGRTRSILLTPQALRTIDRVAGTAGGSGQAVTAGRGPRLTEASLRLDRLQALLAADAPATVTVGEWNFHGLRSAAAATMSAAGFPSAAVQDAIGVRRRSKAMPGTVEWRRERNEARAAIETWNAALEGRSDRG